jgi:hypothetical protein
MTRNDFQTNQSPEIGDSVVMILKFGPKNFLFTKSPKLLNLGRHKAKITEPAQHQLHGHGTQQNL